MLSRRGNRIQRAPTVGINSTGDIFATTERHTAYKLPLYAGPTLQFAVPPDIWATTGVTLNIFAANLIRTQTPWKYKFAFACNVGSYDGTSWNYTPVDGDAGDHALMVQLLNAQTGALIGTQTATVHVTARTSPARAQPLRVVLIGDSVTGFGLYPPPLATLLEGAGNPAFAMYGSVANGTVGGVNVFHDGYGGKTWQWFLTNTPHDANATSPFWRTGGFSVADYITTYCGGLAPDLACFELGINDNFTATPSDDAAIQSSINAMLANADALLSAFQAQCPTTDIGILTTIPGSSSEVGFYFDYSGAHTAWDWQRIQRYLVPQQVAHWTGQQAQKRWLLPANLHLDINNDYPAATQGVHPLAGQGMQRLANTIYAWAKARMAVR